MDNLLITILSSPLLELLKGNLSWDHFVPKQEHIMTNDPRGLP